MGDPHLWVQALSYFGSQPEGNKKIAEVLKHIEDTNLLPPLMVVQILAEYDVATLADIKVVYTLSYSLWDIFPSIKLILN